MSDALQTQTRIAATWTTVCDVVAGERNQYDPKITDTLRSANRSERTPGRSSRVASSGRSN